MRRVSTALIPALALACVALMTASAGAQNPGGSPDGKKMKNPVASSPESIKQGKAASTDGEIFLVIRDGAGPKFEMKGYKSKMTEPDIWNVVNYLRSVQAK